MEISRVKQLQLRGFVEDQSHSPMRTFQLSPTSSLISVPRTRNIRMVLVLTALVQLMETSVFSCRAGARYYRASFSIIYTILTQY